MDKSNKKSAESKEDKKAREKEEKERKQKEEKEKKAAEKERKNKEKMEKEQREKEAKEKKAKEKQEKEIREKEEKERKLREKQMKDKADKEEKERLQREKLEREQREKEKKQYEKELADRIKSEKEAKEKEEKAKKLKEKQEKEQREKEEKERKLKEKEENERKLKEKKEKAEKENKFLRPRDFVASEPNPPVIKVAEPSNPEWGENAQESVFQHDQSIETNHQVRITTPVQVQQDFFPPPPSPSIHEEEIQDVPNQSFPETDEFDQFFNAAGSTFTQQQPYFQDHDQDRDQHENVPVLEEPSLFLDSFGQPLSEKERKKKEKELKAQREKEEKERKKMEKEEKKKEEKEKKMIAKQEKEEQDRLKKQKQKEEKLAKEQAEKEKKEKEKNKNAKGLLEIAQEMRQEQNRYVDETPHLVVNGIVNEDQPPIAKNPDEDLTIDAPQYDLVNEEGENDFDAQFFVNESQAPTSILAPTSEEKNEAIAGRSRKDKASKKKGYVL